MAHRRRYDSDEDDMDDDDRRSRRPGGAADDDQEQDDDGGDRASMSRDYDKTRSKPSLLPAPIRYAGPHDPEGPLAPTETQWGKDHFRLRQPNYAHEILPITPMEEQGWSLQVSRNGRLFWSHPDHGEQWETPAEIKPCLWRVCFQPNGSPAICNMETEELLDAAPDTLPMRQYEEPGDWIKDERDGKIRWFNPRLMKLTRRVPQCLVGQTDVKQNWVVEEAQQHLRYIHNYTREAVYRDTVTERRQETFLQLSAEADAPSNALVDYSASGMSGVFNKRGSLRSVKLRESTFQQFEVRIQPDGSADLVHKASHRVTAKLSPERLKLYRNNIHLRQVFLNSQELAVVGRELQEDDRIVQYDMDGRLFPRTPYQRRKGHAKTTEYWMPRQLFLLDLEFMLNYGHLADTVVVSAGQSCTHINALAEIYFPKHYYIVFVAQDTRIEPAPNVDLIRRSMDESDCHAFAERTILYINQPVVSDDLHVKGLGQAMVSQRNFVNIMQPEMSRLRFLLPWPEKGQPGQVYHYFDGILRYGIFGVLTGTEISLDVSDTRSVRAYDTKDFEELMFHHNTLTRPSYFEHDIPPGSGLDHCYDCSCEIRIFKRYLHDHMADKLKTDEEIREEVVRLSDELSRLVSRNRTLKIDGAYT
eukprot:m.126679 g.126679  ORF g.126679 m.126679 type:complete len:644 (-) comp13840_c0_seq2:2795-4726(-)